MEKHQCEYYKMKQAFIRKKVGKGYVSYMKRNERCKRAFKDASKLREYTIGRKTVKYCRSHYPGQYYDPRQHQNTAIFTEYMELLSPDSDKMDLLYRWTSCRGNKMPTDCLQNILSFMDDTIRLPFNAMTGKPYSGVNSLNLMVSTIKEIKNGSITKYDKPSFATTKQWNDMSRKIVSGNVYPYYALMGGTGDSFMYPIYRIKDTYDASDVLDTD